MRNPSIIYISSFLACACLLALVYLEEPAQADSGQVLGASESFDFELSRANLSLADVLQAETPPFARPVSPSEPELARVGLADFSLPAKSALAIEQKNGQILFEQNADQILPIASISKLMTALVFLDLGPDWSGEYRIKPDDFRGGGYQYAVPGDVLSIKDLFVLSLVASDNTATQALVGASGQTGEEFLARMNEKAAELGLANTGFSDPVGFSRHNVSSARELAELARAAFARSEIREALALSGHEALSRAGRQRHAPSTNKLLGRDLPADIEMLGGKTGSTDLAGNCFAGNFYISGDYGIITVVLGALSDQERFRHSLNLAEWVRDSYRWQ